MQSRLNMPGQAQFAPQVSRKLATSTGVTSGLQLAIALPADPSGYLLVILAFCINARIVLRCVAKGRSGNVEVFTFGRLKQLQQNLGASS